MLPPLNFVNTLPCETQEVHCMSQIKAKYDDNYDEFSKFLLPMLRELIFQSHGYLLHKVDVPVKHTL